LYPYAVGACFLQPRRQGLSESVPFGINGGADFLSAHPRDRPYQAGRSKHWIKVKNREHQAFDRAIDALS